MIIWSCIIQFWHGYTSTALLYHFKPPPLCVVLRLPYEGSIPLTSCVMYNKEKDEIKKDPHYHWDLVQKLISHLGPFYCPDRDPLDYTHGRIAFEPIALFSCLQLWQSRVALEKWNIENERGRWKESKENKLFFLFCTLQPKWLWEVKRRIHTFAESVVLFFQFPPSSCPIIPLWENMARLLYRNDLTNYLKVSKLSVINDEIKNASLLYIFAYTTKREREKKRGEFDECETEEVPKNEIIFDFLPDSLPSSYIASHLSNVCMYIYTHCSWDIYRHAQRPPLTPRWRY